VRCSRDALPFLHADLVCARRRPRTARSTGLASSLQLLAVRLDIRGEKGSTMKSVRTALLSSSIMTAVALAALGAARAEDGPPPGSHHGPPAAAIDACKQKKEGDACTVTFRDQSITGICRTHDDQLACWPDRPPPRPKDDQPSP
jgi:hypothetical protein